MGHHTTNKLFCKNSSLQLVGTLNGGQSFRWKKVLKQEDKEQWIGVFANRVWVLEQEGDYIRYEVREKEGAESLPSEAYNSLLRDYFRLDSTDLEKHYAEWSAKDPIFKRAADQFYGIRILKQDVTENLFSFICSQNNHISRISTMVENLARFYGEKICEMDDAEYFSFPKVDALAGPDVEANLRANGYGYRAKYISASAKSIVKRGGESWLDSLEHMEYASAKTELMSLMGIGAKVADCICLMSLGHLGAIPVDTHVYQIAARFYMPKLAKQKTVTEKVYNEIGEHFRGLFGPLAGWAHTVLFCADLKKFQNPEVAGKENGEGKKTKNKRRKTEC